MANKAFFIDEYIDNPNATVRVSIPRLSVGEDVTVVTGVRNLGGNSSGVVGFITSQLKIGITADHNSPLMTTGSERFAEMYGKIKVGIASIFGSSISNVSPIALQQTVASWTGTEKPQFSMDMIFVSVRDTDDVRVPVMQLYKTVMPTGVKQGAATFLRAPLDYLPTGSTARNTLAVEVGGWFRAKDQIMKNVSFNFSKQSTASGRPLYAEGSITFEPFRAITFDELVGYILGGSA